MKRIAPESKGILEQLDTATKVKDKQVESFEQKKRRILERCGCL